MIRMKLSLMKTERPFVINRFLRKKRKKEEINILNILKVIIIRTILMFNIYIILRNYYDALQVLELYQNTEDL
jgi:hypothetical protein